jgi:hypothetical protein
MRRPVASLLLLILFAGIGLPLLQAQPASHACCRRGAQHHCDAPVSGDGFRSLASCCLYRHPHALNRHGSSALGVSPNSTFQLSAEPTAALLPSAPAAQIFARNNPQRGPPLS